MKFGVRAPAEEHRSPSGIMDAPSLITPSMPDWTFKALDLGLPQHPKDCDAKNRQMCKKSAVCKQRTSQQRHEVVSSHA